MRTALLIGSLALAGMASAQIFQNGFEDWTGTWPDGWNGSTTNIPATGIAQVTDNVHGGTKAIRLTNTTTTHKRFSTQPLAVVDGQSYQVSFWVRGNGKIRVGLFDGRPGSTSGYAGYVPQNYVAVNSATWMQVTQTITAATDTSIAQFILSVVSTVAPDHLVVDDVNISLTAPPAATSIYAIQYTTDPSGNSPLNNQTVITGGIVTGVISGANGGYFVQSGTGPWTGIYVFDTNNIPAIGDSVTFMGTVSEFNGNTELTAISNFVVASSGHNVQAYDVATGDVSLEPLESVLVRVVNTVCTVVPSGATFGKYNVDDGSGACVIGKVMYTTTPNPVLNEQLSVTGVDYFAYAEYNIQPRMASDVDFISGIANAGAMNTITFGPNPASDLLNINFGSAAGFQMNYTLTDLQGRTLQAGQFTGDRAQLNVSDMATGLYHLTLRSNTLVKTFAVQVAH